MMLGRADSAGLSRGAKCRTSASVRQRFGCVRPLVARSVIPFIVGLANKGLRLSKLILGKAYPGQGMSNSRSLGVCPFCRRWWLVRNEERLAVQQSTDRGDIHCEVSVPIDSCSRCGARSWNEIADALVEQALQRRYEELS